MTLLDSIKEQFETFSRKTFKVLTWDITYGEDGKILEDKTREEASIKEAHVISSEVRLHDNLHRPVIDIDVPIRVFPSTTPGHFHLYIDYLVPWDDYLDMLKAMAKCGIVEWNYIDASIARGGTHVRLPWIKKGTENQ